MSAGRTLVSPKAREDLEDIVRYIGADDVGAASRVVDAIEEAFEKLGNNPGIGVEVKGLSNPSLQELRMWVLPRFRNYVIFYLPSEAGAEVVRVMHGARDIKNLLDQ